MMNVIKNKWNGRPQFVSILLAIFISFSSLLGYTYSLHKEVGKQQTANGVINTKIDNLVEDNKELKKTICDMQKDFNDNMRDVSDKVNGIKDLIFELHRKPDK